MGLIRFFGQEKAIVVGHDWGGAVGWVLAAKHPEATERLIVCSIPHLGVFREMAGQGFVEHYTALQHLFYILFFRTPDVPERFFSKDSHAFFDAYGLINADCFSPEVIAEYKKAIGKPGALTAGLNYYRANLPPEVLVGEVPLLEETVACPTLFMYGENEPLVTPSVLEWTREFVNGPFTVRHIPHCGHCVQQEAPELVNQYILEFLADL